MPYLLEIDHANKVYWIKNREYEYIDDQSKSRSDVPEQIEYKYVSANVNNNTGLMPWNGISDKESNQIFNQLKTNFESLTKGLECKTFCDETFKLLYS